MPKKGKAKRPVDLPPKATLHNKNNRELDYPVFCFKHLQTHVSIKGCPDSLFTSFIKRIQKLSVLGWDEINKSHRHSFGWEKISRDKIKPDLPAFVTRDVESFYVFRYTGNNRPFLAMKTGNILHVLFIEANFGDIYDH